MKSKKTIKFASIVLMALITLSACESGKAGNKSDLNNQLILALLNRTTENAEARQYCAGAVARMNQCIGADSGFNPAVMCSDENINKGIAGDASATPPVVAKTGSEVYAAMISCIDGQIALTNCNYPQNKVASPNHAKQSFFSKCDSPSGAIITIF